MGWFGKPKAEGRTQSILAPVSEEVQMGQPSQAKVSLGKRLGQWLKNLQPAKSVTAKPSAPSAKKAKSKLSSAPTCELIVGQNEDEVYVFGLHWSSMVTAPSQDAAAKQAIKAKATHYIYMREQVGYGVLPKTIKGKTPYPAAAIAAKNFNGTALFVLQIDGQPLNEIGLYWVAITSNGYPTSYDLVVSGNGYEVAKNAISMVEQDGQDYSIHSNFILPGFAPWDAIKHYGFTEIFQTYHGSQDKLVEAKLVIKEIPAPFKVLIGVGVLGVIGQQAFNYYADMKAKEQLLQKTADIPPEEAWAPVLAAYRAQLINPTSEQLASVRKSIDEQPVLWNGWAISGLRCAVSMPEKVVPLPGMPVTALPFRDKRIWNCEASYQRSRVADTYQEILAKTKGTKWTATKADLRSMSLAWQVEQQVAPVEFADLPLTQPTVISLISSMQEISPAIDEPTAPSFQPVDWSAIAPKKPDGSSYDRPMTMPDLAIAPIRFKAPLRSIDLVLERFPQITWTAIGITFDLQPVAEKADLRTSALTAEIEGVFHARNK